MYINRLLFVFIILIAFQFIRCDEKQPKPFHEMDKYEIHAVLKDFRDIEMTVTEKINYFSERFLGMPYNLTCAGDGPYALLEAWPLVNFDQTNCMVFCEHVLALSISDSWDNFFNNLQQIRYKDGIIGMKTRNHYTMADWLPENNWLLADVSRQVGGKHTKSVTRTISHKTFFKNKGMTDMLYVKPDREITVEYVPLDALAEVEDNTKTGDICALLFAGKDDIFSAHMLMVAEKDGQKVFRESSSSKMTTFDTPYQEWVKDKVDNFADSYIGLAFMRVKPGLNTPGKIILPWHIDELKSE